jgi:hypothetical protein
MEKVELATESRWDRSKRQQSVFPTWAAAVASALGGTLAAPRNPENAGHWQTVRLPDGLTFDLHLNGYESRVAVRGNWPRDGGEQCVTPREAIRYDTEAAKIQVGAERDPAAAAKDIARRFLPAYREQYAACLARVEQRNAYQNKVTANTRRLADVLGLDGSDKNSVRIADGRGELHPSLSGLCRGVSVSDDSARFELELPLEQAQKILQIISAWALEEWTKKGN